MYQPEEVLVQLLEPTIDSEIEDLDESDTEEYIDQSAIVPQRIVDNDTPANFEKDLEQDAEGSTADGNSDFSHHIFRWRSMATPMVSTPGSPENDFSLPPSNVDEMTPLAYFQKFWKPELNEHIAHQTNLYGMQKECYSVGTSRDEIEQFIGMQMLMSVIKLPAYDMYWATETRYDQVANVMGKNRYKTIRRFLHVNDNSELNDETIHNKLFKIQPVLYHVRENCKALEPEVQNSIDEQIIPAKTVYSGIRQYNPKKPKKWGFKNFVRSGSSGMMYDFFLYQGATTSADGQKCTGSYVVLKLSEGLPKHQQFKIFFDNWFCSLQLCLQLKSMGYLVTATVRADRVKKCPLPSEKELKKLGRGAHAYKTDANSGLTITKWYDNKCVQMASTYCNPDASAPVKRWDRANKRYIEINCPTVVHEYNKNMGGVDLSDMLIALYRTQIKIKRWYLKVLFHCVDIAKVNAWLLYRRHCEQLGTPKRRQLSLLKFTIAIASALIHSRTLVSGVGRPLKRKSSGGYGSNSKKVPTAPSPIDDIRFDHVSHWPEYKPDKRKCKLCKIGQSRVYCIKCKVCLCLSNERNCFLKYHTNPSDTAL